MSRDPKRIPRIMHALHWYWDKYPDLRLGQLVIGLCGTNPFQAEDDVPMAEIERRLPEAFLACQPCGKTFLRMWTGDDDYKQASDCSARTFSKNDQWHLVAGYGSDFDMNVYRFRSEPRPEWQGAESVCDACIRSLLEVDALELIGQDTPSGFLSVDDSLCRA